MKKFLLLSCMAVLAMAFTVHAEYQPHFLIDSGEEWASNLGSQNILPLTENEWTDYMAQWDAFIAEGAPYPDALFSPPTLYISEGQQTEPPIEDAGLVMVWDYPLQEGSFAGAWAYDYGTDPDLSNSIIKITVTPPSSAGISAISFGIQDVGGAVRSWWWSVPSTAVPYDSPTTVTIDTSLTGTGAATPAATGYMNNPAFNIAQARFFIADENGAWVGGPIPVSPPGVTGVQYQALWNYWHNLTVTPKTTIYKGYYVKWSQPPVQVQEKEGMINGWDEPSTLEVQQIMADDWECRDDRPVTDIHWWGSFIGWTQPRLPPVLPKGFHIGIWTDVPQGPNNEFSHPGEMIWAIYCDNWVWNFAGYDLDPREPGQGGVENEACFQFNQLLSQDEWFYQKPSPDGAPTVYWLSIAADYGGQTPEFPWGWKTRPRHFNDDAVRILDADQWPPGVGAKWTGGDPVEYPEKTSWDLAFELTTNQGSVGDVNNDGITDLKDAIHALQVVTGLR